MNGICALFLKLRKLLSLQSTCLLPLELLKLLLPQQKGIHDSLATTEVPWNGDILALAWLGGAILTGSFGAASSAPPDTSRVYRHKAHAPTR